jgi:WD40 repeat protein
LDKPPNSQGILNFCIFSVSASQDGSIKMFDLLEARPIYDVLGHKESVTSVKFSTKGDYFASGSEDKMVYVWKTNFDEVDEQVRFYS